ncbi:hypothetical protein QQ045_032478 [Rhodiola kirilowii]
MMMMMMMNFLWLFQPAFQSPPPLSPLSRRPALLACQRICHAIQSPLQLRLGLLRRIQEAHHLYIVQIAEPTSSKSAQIIQANRSYRIRHPVTIIVENHESDLVPQMGLAVPIYIDIIAFLCTAGAISLAILHIYKHLLNYTKPTYQRYIVRIVFMVPVYALTSFLSLVFPDTPMYFRSAREIWDVIVFLAAKTGFIKDADEAAEFQDFKYVWKCFLRLWDTFMPSRTKNMLEQILFAPTYHDYVLYNHGDKGNEGPTKYRSRTFVPTGHEMDAVTNKVNDIQLSTPPSSASNTPMRSVSGHPEGMRSSIPRHIPIYATKPPGATKDSNTI